MNEIEQTIETIGLMESEYSHVRQNDREWDAMEAATLALREKAEREHPEPLTLEELRKMDGEPVYAIDGSGTMTWVLVDVDSENRPNGIDKDTELWDGDFYGMKEVYPDPNKLHLMGWLAYRYPPKKEVVR